MDGNGQGVLTEQHFNDMQAALTQLDEAERQLKLAKLAGINTAGQEQQIADTRQKIAQVKAVYFPGR